jgi:hypothetical protein
MMSNDPNTPPNDNPFVVYGDWHAPIGDLKITLRESIEKCRSETGYQPKTLDILQYLENVNEAKIKSMESKSE